MLLDRALCLAKARQFFFERNIIEVDCPLMGRSAPIDLHIDLFKAYSKEERCHYLHSSPEYFMKRLLSQGSGDIYQLAHVFRDEETSLRHNTEFMMAEWYRLGFSLEEMINETLAFIELFIGKKNVRHLTFRQAFKDYLNIDYVNASNQELFDCLEKNGIIPYQGIMQEGKDALLNLILGTLIEPEFKKEDFVILKHYPESFAALAKKIQVDDELVGMRFEVYYEGLELANGYLELLDANEQLARLQEALDQRKMMGKEELPIDYGFLEALKTGIPECSGVAVGFDRILMKKYNTQTLKEVIPFAYDET